MARARPGLGGLGRAVAAGALAAAIGAGFLLWVGRGGREEEARGPAAQPPDAALERAERSAPGDAPRDPRRLESPGAEVSTGEAEPAPEPDPSSLSEATDPRREHLTGVVTDEHGQPLVARVSLYLRRVETDHNTGAFDLDLTGMAPLDDPLVATSRGRAPAVLHGVGQAFVDGGHRHPPLVIVLSPGGRLAGVVLDHEGAPAAGVLVAVREAEPDAEGVAERASSTRGALPVQTDEDGSFELDGLRPMPYTLIAVDPVTLDRVERAALPDASGAYGIELRLPAPDARRDVQGVARFPDGTPADGRTISAFVALPGSMLQPYRIRRTSLTDDDGAFVLEDLPAQDLQIFAGWEIHPWTSPLPAQATRIELELNRLCPLVVRWPAGSPPPDAGRAVSAAGEELPIYERHSGAIRRELRLRFLDRGDANGEQTVSLLAPENAAVLLLERDGRPLASAPIAPRVDAELVVRP